MVLPVVRAGNRTGRPGVCVWRPACRERAAETGKWKSGADSPAFYSQMGMWTLLGRAFPCPSDKLLSPKQQHNAHLLLQPPGSTDEAGSEAIITLLP